MLILLQHTSGITCKIKMETDGSKMQLAYIFYMYLYSYKFCISDKIFILNTGNDILLLEDVRILLGWNVTAVELTEDVQLGSSCFHISTQNTEYRIQNVFIVNQIKPLYYNMLLFTINVRRQIYFANLYSRVTGTLCLYSRTTGILCALAWGG